MKCMCTMEWSCIWVLSWWVSQGCPEVQISPVFPMSHSSAIRCIRSGYLNLPNPNIMLTYFLVYFINITATLWAYAKRLCVAQSRTVWMWYFRYSKYPQGPWTFLQGPWSANKPSISYVSLLSNQVHSEWISGRPRAYTARQRTRTYVFQMQLK